MVKSHQLFMEQNLLTSDRVIAVVRTDLEKSLKMTLVLENSLNSKKITKLLKSVVKN